MIITHTDVLFDVVILLIWNVDRFVSPGTQSPGNLPRITFIGFNLTSFLFGKSRRSDDDTFDSFSLKTFIKSVAKASGFIAGDDLNIVTMIFFDPTDVLQDILYIRSEFDCREAVVSFTGVAAESVVG